MGIKTLFRIFTPENKAAVAAVFIFWSILIAFAICSLSVKRRKFQCINGNRYVNARVYAWAFYLFIPVLPTTALMDNRPRSVFVGIELMA